MNTYLFKVRFETGIQTWVHVQEKTYSQALDKVYAVPEVVSTWLRTIITPTEKNIADPFTPGDYDIK